MTDERASTEQSAAPEAVQSSGTADTTPGTTASRTARAYEHDWTGFQRWCRAAGCPALPASPDAVAAYLAALVAERPRRRGTLDRHFAAIGRAHRAADHAWDTQHPAIRTVLRAAPRGPRVKRLTPGQLGRLSAACGSDLAGLRDRALLLPHLAAGLRRGEVVGLDREHVSFTPAGLHLLLVPPEREENQRPPPVECVVPPGADAPTCPVRALRTWLDASACRHGPVFRKVDRWGHVEPERLHVDEVRRILVRRASKAKLGLHTSQRLNPCGTDAARAARPEGGLRWPGERPPRGPRKRRTRSRRGWTVSPPRRRVRRRCTARLRVALQPPGQGRGRAGTVALPLPVAPMLLARPSRTRARAPRP